MFVLALAFANVYGQDNKHVKNSDLVISNAAKRLSQSFEQLSNAEGKSLNAVIISVDHSTKGDPSMLNYIRLELDKELASQSTTNKYAAFRMVEQQKLDPIWKQQILTCTRQDVSDSCYIKLGQNLMADRLISVTVTKDLLDRKHWHRMYVTVRNARNAQVEDSFDEQLYYKEKQNYDEILPTEQVTVRGPLGEWKNGFGAVVGGSYEQYFDTWRPSVTLDLLGNTDHVSIGVRLGYMPNLVNSPTPLFDYGHVVSLLASDSLSADQVGIMVGNTFMAPNDMALISANPLNISWDMITNDIDPGVSSFTFDRIRMTSVTAYRISIHPCLRVYPGDRYNERSSAKFFIDLGIGWDLIKARAAYAVTRTVVTQNADLSYTTEVLYTTPTSYDYAGYKKNLSLGTLQLGAGFEVSRFMLSASWRFLSTPPFKEPYTTYRRVKGDILLLPLMSDGFATANSVSTGLAANDALLFGKVNIPATNDSRLNGSGVNRFLVRSNIMFTLGIRLF